jgi:hypothetical protein
MSKHSLNIRNKIIWNSRYDTNYINTQKDIHMCTKECVIKIMGDLNTLYTFLPFSKSTCICKQKKRGTFISEGKTD